MEKETLTVPNISCGHCVMNIKNELSEMEGVNSVDGSPEAKRISGHAGKDKRNLERN
jgi:copper chaperone CopZ